MPTLVASAFWLGYHHGTSPATITLRRCLFLGYWIWIPFSHWRSGPRCLDAMACMKGMRDSDFFCILVVDDWREQRRWESWKESWKNTGDLDEAFRHRKVFLFSHSIGATTLLERWLEGTRIENKKASTYDFNQGPIAAPAPQIWDEVVTGNARGLGRIDLEHYGKARAVRRDTSCFFDTLSNLRIQADVKLYVLSTVVAGMTCLQMAQVPCSVPIIQSSAVLARVLAEKIKQRVHRLLYLHPLQ